MYEDLQQVWDELQEIPSYIERFDPNTAVQLIVVQFCETCGVWHNADDGCPVKVEA